MVQAYNGQLYILTCNQMLTKRFLLGNPDNGLSDESL